MSWKQPIPSVTELRKIFGSDYRSMLLYKELIWRANNSDNAVISFETKRGAAKSVSLKRGQVLYGRNKFAEYLSWNDKTTDRCLEKLTNVYNLVSNQRTHDFTIVSLKNYESLVGFVQPNDHPNVQPVTTSKSDKSELINTTSTELFVQDNESLQLLECITPEDITNTAQLFSISEEDVKGVLQKLKDKAIDGTLKSRIKDAGKTLEFWVKNDIKWGNIKPAQTLEEVIREQTGELDLKIS